MADGNIAGVKVTGSQDRDSQKSYWKEHSKEATVEAMMLDSKAAEIDKLERPEVGQPCQQIANNTILCKDPSRVAECINSNQSSTAMQSHVSNLSMLFLCGWKICVGKFVKTMLKA